MNCPLCHTPAPGWEGHGRFDCPACGDAFVGDVRPPIQGPRRPNTYQIERAERRLAADTETRNQNYWLSHDYEGRGRNPSGLPVSIGVKDGLAR